ncbi:sterol desaturase family protein [Bacteriovoracaceae bacterium]|nr:sterol desaturase family protein [Bacteriovoracaceae bacterium]
MPYFEVMPISHKVIWVFLTLIFAWVIEDLYPLKKIGKKKSKIAKLNLTFLLFTFIINTIFTAILVLITNWAQLHQYGLFFTIDFSYILKLIIGILILDLVAQYFTHLLLHKVQWMWSLHVIHHSDFHVNSTTGTRHHPIDYLLREIFAMIIVLIFGIPMSVYLFYKFLTIFFTYFTHANIKIPLYLDNLFGYIFITPNMHKFHHHEKKPWTNKNYGNVFSIWDRLFGTIINGDPNKVNFGLDCFDKSKQMDMKYLLKYPFIKNENR